VEGVPYHKDRLRIPTITATTQSAMEAPQLHIAMYPWFAMGHCIPFLHLSNKLAMRGHRISLFIPKKAQTKIQHLNHHPNLITFIPITVPHVDGLPPDAETTSDVPFSQFPLLATAMDLTQDHIEQILLQIKPNIVFFDFSFWLPNLTKKLGIKSVQYIIVNPLTVAYLGSPTRELTEDDLTEPPSGFPDSSIKLNAHEARVLSAFGKMEFGSGVLFKDRLSTGRRLCDAIGFKGCREIEGPYVDYLEKQFKKSVILSGPLLPEPTNSCLEEKWANWLAGFEPSSVIFCAFGSETILEVNQFQELLLGLELTGFPFLAALKQPIGFQSIEEALPEGFNQRVKGRGIVYGGWIQQQLILAHESILLYNTLWYWFNNRGSCE
jgi:hypothetical protein